MLGSERPTRAILGQHALPLWINVHNPIVMMR